MVGFYDLCIHGGIHGLPAHTQQDASRLGRGKLDAVVLLADGRLLGCHRGGFPHGSSSMALADRQTFWQNVEAVYYDLSRFGCRQFRRHIRRNVCPNLLLPYGIFTASGSAATADSAAGSPSLLIIVLFALAIVAATALCMAVSLPFAYLTPKYMLQEKGEKLRPWKSFKCGFRHMGSIFKMGFLGSLVILVAGILIYIPLAILIGAQVSAQMGTLEGDPVGTPSYFTFLFIVVTALLLFVFAYILHWLFISYIYLYGSIENDEMKKTEMLNAKC